MKMGSYKKSATPEGPAAMTRQLQHHIGGREQPGNSGRYGDVFDPASGQVSARVPLAGADDGELFLEYRESEGFSFDDGRLKSAPGRMSGVIGAAPIF